MQSYYNHWKSQKKQPVKKLAKESLEPPIQPEQIQIQKYQLFLDVKPRDSGVLFVNQEITYTSGMELPEGEYQVRLEHEDFESEDFFNIT